MKEEILEVLNRLGISYEQLEHDPIRTMEEGDRIAQQLGVTPCKCLFLCNKRPEYYLLLLPGQKKLEAKKLARQLDSPHLSFCTSDELQRMLHTVPGAVSLLGLLYDTAHRIRLLVDEELMAAEYIGCHPCVNTCSLKIRLDDLLHVFLPSISHEYNVVSL